MNKDFEIPEAFTQEEIFAWYTIRIFSVNEDKVISELKEKIKQFGLDEKIKEIEVLKEYKIEESKEYPPNSEDLPQRGLKNTVNSFWVKTVDGNYKKIKFVEKRPFKGNAFIKMTYNMEIFKRIQSWSLGVNFLNYPNLQAISDFSFKKMKNSLNKEAPSLDEYVKDNFYVVVQGNLKECELIENKNKPISVKQDEESDVDKNIEKSISEKNKTTQEDSSVKYSVKNKPINIKKLRVNDNVYMNELGVTGIVQSINVDIDEIIVSVQIFGRRQPIKCNSSELSEI